MQPVRHGRLTGVWPLALLYVAATSVYALAGRAMAVPIIAPDEYTYGHLAQSVANGDGLSWGGESFALRSALYVYAIAPLWALASATDAYGWTKVVGAAASSAVVFPTWLLARPFVGPRTALVPAALSVAGAWMTIAGLVVTEVLAFPLAVASLAAMVQAIRQPGWRWSATALGLAALAALARSQLVVLPLVLLLAVLAEALCQGSRFRSRLAEQRALLGVIGFLIVLGTVVALVVPSALGRYSGLVTDDLHLDRGPGAGRDQLAALLVLSGFLPLIVSMAGSLSRDAWRDRTIASLLAVTWSAAGVLVIQSALGVSFWEVDWSIERYVMYCVPLLLVAMTTLLARNLVEWRRLAAVAGAAALLALLVPGVRSYIEEPALFGLYRRIEPLFGPSPATGAAVVLVALACAAVVLVRRQPARPLLNTLLVALFTFVVLIVQSQATWAHRDSVTHYWRSGLAADLSWVDARVEGSVAHFIVLRRASRFPTTEFFNSRITRTYAFDQFLPGNANNALGRICSWSTDATGSVSFERACGPRPTRLLLDDEAVDVTFHRQRVIADVAGVARVVEIPLREPRILALATPSCSTPLPTVETGLLGRLRPRQPLECSESFESNLFLDEPAIVIASFRGGTGQGMVAMGDQQRPIAPGATVTLRTRQPAGATSIPMAVQPSGPPPANPQLVSLELVQDGKRTQLLY